MTIKDDAAKTAALLRKDGWCTDAYVTPEGQHCIYGAIAQAVYGDVLLGREDGVWMAEHSKLADAVLKRLTNLLDIEQGQFGELSGLNDNLDSVTPLLTVLDDIAGGR